MWHTPFQLGLLAKKAHPQHQDLTKAQARSSAMSMQNMRGTQQDDGMSRFCLVTENRHRVVLVEVFFWKDQLFTK